MSLGEGTGRRWADLCERHDAAKKEVDAALKVVQDRFLGVDGKRPGNPSAEEMARLEDARARRAEVEREMDDFMTTRR
jgi:hypothetical protein